MAIKQKKVRIWWLTYGVDILCHACGWSIVPIEEVWCGCRPVPRKMKKWIKGRREAYKVQPVETFPLDDYPGATFGYYMTGGDK